MLSKEVKIRIASNKYFRRVPKWQRQMYEHFRREIASAQRMYDTAKHFEGSSGEALRAVRLANRNLLEQASRTWKRADWLKHLRYQQSLMKHKRQLNPQTFGRLAEVVKAATPIDEHNSVFGLKSIKLSHELHLPQPVADALNDFTNDTIALNQKLRDQQGE